MPVVAVLGIVVVFFMWNNLQTTKKNTASIQTQVNAKQALITANTKSVADLTQQNRTAQAQIAPLLASAQVFPDEMSSLATARGLVESQMAQIFTLLPATVNLTSVAYTGVTDTISRQLGVRTEYFKLCRGFTGYRRV